MELVAQSVGFEIDEEDEVVEAGFSEGIEEPGFTLLIQRTDYEPDEQDISLGMDTYCLVSGGRTHYGGLLRVEREGDVLRFGIAAQAAAVLNVPEHLTVRFEAPAENVTAYVTGLPDILDWGRAEERPVLVGF
ncbi:Imm10 family immunity protein [Streptomyces sp. NPDC005329]|uniref:Imm10 family immunity protein n=1 Tax=Streptomyces sp. NPDC005329 TaxID=3157034 RepID=UPI0033A12726